MTVTQDRSPAAWPHQALLVFAATEARAATAMFERLFPCSPTKSTCSLSASGRWVGWSTFADAGLTVVGLEAGPWRTKDECLPEELGQAYYARGGLGPKFQLETPRWRQRG